MTNEFTVFCVVPWEYNFAGVKAKHNVVFQTEDERVTKLLIDGFRLSTIDVEVGKTSPSYEKSLANESIYAINECATVSSNAKVCKCDFCSSTEVVGRVMIPDGNKAYYCCSSCGKEAIDQGYDQGAYCASGRSGTKGL